MKIELELSHSPILHPSLLLSLYLSTQRHSSSPALPSHTLLSFLSLSTSLLLSLPLDSTAVGVPPPFPSLKQPPTTYRPAFISHRRPIGDPPPSLSLHPPLETQPNPSSLFLATYRPAFISHRRPTALPLPSSSSRDPAQPFISRPCSLDLHLASHRPTREPPTHPRTHFTPIRLPALPRDSLPPASHRPPFISHYPPSPFIPLPRPTLIRSSPTASRKFLDFLSLDLPPVRHLRSIQVARWTMIPPRTNSFKASSNNTTKVGSNAFKLRPDGPQNHQLIDLVKDIHLDFAENGVFSNEMSDLDYEWKF
ncbi:hypothetical protein ACLOJK_032007 [Asimina triloba]